jgi:hypothetical protein
MSGPPVPPPGVVMIAGDELTEAGQNMADALLDWCIDQINKALIPIDPPLAAKVAGAVAMSVIFSRCHLYDEAGEPQAATDEARARFHTILTHLLRAAFNQDLLPKPQGNEPMLLAAFPEDDAPKPPRRTH